MRNIVFIGNSLAHAVAIDEIMRINSECALTLISSDACLSYSRSALMKMLSREIKEKQCLYRPEVFYKENKVRTVLGQTVTRINFKRSQIFLENKDHIAYDILVLSDLAAPRFPEIKGHNKIGVYQSVQFSSVKEIIEQLVFAQTIVVEINTWHGFSTLCGLSNYNKEIIAVTKNESLLPEVFDAESSSMLKQILEYKGVRMMFNNPIDEILGDSDLKAVRLKSGKVLSAEMVILDDLYCDTRIFKDSGFEKPQMNSENYEFQSNIPNVYWSDAIRNNFLHSRGCDYKETDAELERQGKSIARTILGASEPVKGVQSINKFSFKDLQGVWFGQCGTSQDINEFSRFFPETNTYAKIFCKDGFLFGGVLLNCQEAIDKIVELYVNHTNIQGMEEQLFNEHLFQVSLSDAQQPG